MPAALDVATSLLHVAGGRLLPDEPPGYNMLAAPRKAARGREHDTLFLCLGLRAREAIPSERYDELIDLAARTFFGGPGSVTSALRQALIAVNQKLLDENLGGGPLRAAGTPPLQGGLIAAALREADFYAVQSGPGLLLIIRPAGHERFPNAPTRPLGASNTVEAVYFHTQVAAGDYVCFSNAPARGWSDIALVGLGNLAGLTAVAERLRETAGGDAAALLARFEMGGVTAGSTPAPAAAPISVPARQTAAPVPEVPAPQPVARAARRTGREPGAGLAEFFRLKPRPSQTAEPPELQPTNGPGEAADSPARVDAAGAVQPEVFWGTPRGTSASTAAEPERMPAAAPVPRRAEPPGLPQLDAVTAEPERAVAAHDSPAAAASEPPRAPRKPGVLSAVGGRMRQALRAMGRAVGVTLAELIRGVRTALARLLPEGTLQRDGLFTVPTSVQVSIAILIPVLVVGTSVWLYLDNGRSQQYTAALSQAQVEVAHARVATDALSARPHWEAALQWLAQAEALRPGQPEVATLMQESQAKLDEMDWITRLDYQPLLSAGLGAQSKVARLLLSGPDVYVLDVGHNRVARVTPNTAGGATATNAYILDPAFQCAGSQTMRNVKVAQLIDIAVIPGPTVIGGDTTVNGDVLLAMDSLGTLLYCAPGLDQPYASYLAPPVVGWVRPLSLQLYGDRLYILDPGGNEIWQYQASGGAFSEAPTRYFTSASYNLADVIGFTIAGGDVFLLRKNGQVTNCTRTTPGGSPTCTEVVQFSDPRLGRGVGNRLADLSQPAQLVYDAPPEPSLYLLDGQTSGLYQLSLKMSLVRQFRPYFLLPAPISAAAIDPAKRFFAGAGDNIYVAARP